jgi:hypothetical protein
MTHLDRDPKSLVATLNQALASYHKDLREVGVKITVLMARAFDANEDPIAAVKLAGCACLAKIRVYNTKQRLLTGADAEIVVDGRTYDDLDDAQQVALFDHELSHLDLVYGLDKKLSLDDLGRPKLKTHPDDFMLTGFYDVIRRHGESANEAGAVMRVNMSVKAALKDAASGNTGRREDADAA